MFEIYPTPSGREIHCKIYIDPGKRIIHVLDLAKNDTMTVTNGIEHIQHEILKRHGLIGSVADWTWVLYGTDGIATTFDHGAFQIAPGKILHWPFLVECCERIRSPEK